ncbi:MAG TPA: DUF3761 domain-containing protein [Rhodanobacteraceae bacterium]|nr:DUF3761 domain-containing protein [Rhodanobacteraceae bacterium]
MKTLLVSIATTFALVLASAAHAAPPSGAPAGTTGLCKDGSYYSGESKRGACRGHKGVKEWYGAASASSTESAPAPTESRKAPKKKREARVAEAPPAASTSAAPAGATGLCKDGSYYSGESKRGACRGHKGVKEWYGATKTATPVAAPASVPAPASAPVAPVAKAPASGAMSSPTRSIPAASSPAPGGGNGKVWVNTSSKVYHCAGDRYYGATKTGEYMSESDAVAKGNRPAHGKACAS